MIVPAGRIFTRTSILTCFMSPKEHKLLLRYFPEASIEKVYASIVKYNAFLRVSKSRRSKLGDFRPPAKKGDHHRISVNHDLHPYQFLITFVHELAHLVVYEQFGRQANPHGPIWKKTFQRLMQDFLVPEIFPPELIIALQKSLQNAKASSGADHELTRLLHSYDEKKAAILTVEDLVVGSAFVLPDGRVFVKHEKLRKRYKCQCQKTKKWYLFNPLAPVEKIALLQS